MACHQCGSGGVLKKPCSANFLSRFERTNDFTPVWDRLFTFKLPCFVNSVWKGKLLISSVGQVVNFKLPCFLSFLSYFEQANYFSQVWVMLCNFKLDCFVNFLSQFEQANDFSPEWVRLCTFKLDCFVNFLSQIEQANGFSPEWVRLCA